MKFADCCNDYLNHIRFERGLAKTTCLHYQCWLRHFTDWLAEAGYSDPHLEAVFTVPVLRRYLYHKAKAGCRPRTLHSAFHALRGLGVFLVEAGALSENPARQITLPKKDAASRETITHAEITALFEACERQRTPRQIALSRAVLSTLAYAALRRSELCDLRVSDVDVAEKSILVRSGKGSKSRRVFVCTDAANALREWLVHRRNEWEATYQKAAKPQVEKDYLEGWLFMYDRARRLHHQGIATLIGTLAATAGMADNPALRPHSIRHWAATNLLRNGANLRDVQAFLGHSDLTTTARYLHSSEEQLRKVAELTALPRVGVYQQALMQHPDAKNQPNDREAFRPMARSRIVVPKTR